MSIDRAVFLIQRHKAWLVRIGIPLAVICAGALLGLAVVWVNPLFVLVGVMLPLGGVILARRLELGVVLVLVLAVFARIRIPTGTVSEIVMSLVLSLGLVSLWIVHMFVEERRLFLRPIPVNVPLFGFMGAVLISVFWGQAFRDVLVHPYGSDFVPYASALVMILLPGTLILVANVIGDLRWLQIAVWVFCLTGAVALVVSLAMDLNLGPAAIRNFVSGNGIVWVNNQGLFAMWYVALALSLALFNRRLSLVLRGLLLVYVAGWVYWGFWLRINWLSGWLPGLAAAAVIVWSRSKVVFILLAIVLIVGAGGYYLETRFDDEVSESGNTRLFAYGLNWRVTSKHLLFGTGPGGYLAYYMSYFPAESLASHSNYIDILAQTGLVGALFFLWFLVSQGWNTYWIQQRLAGHRDFQESLSVALLAGTAGCVLAMGLGDWIIPFTYTQGIIGFDGSVVSWFFMGAFWSFKHVLGAGLSQSRLPAAQPPLFSQEKG